MRNRRKYHQRAYQTSDRPPGQFLHMLVFVFGSLSSWPLRGCSSRRPTRSLQLLCERVFDGGIPISLLAVATCCTWLAVLLATRRCAFGIHDGGGPALEFVAVVAEAMAGFQRGRPWRGWRRLQMAARRMPGIVMAGRWYPVADGEHVASAGDGMGEKRSLTLRLPHDDAVKLGKGYRKALGFQCRQARADDAGLARLFGARRQLLRQHSIVPCRRRSQFGVELCQRVGRSVGGEHIAFLDESSPPLREIATREPRVAWPCFATMEAMDAEELLLSFKAALMMTLWRFRDEHFIAPAVAV